MASTYEPIASQTLGSDTASVSFSTISGSFTDLVLVTALRSDRAGESIDGVALRFNSDSGSNYSITQMIGNGSAASSSRSSSATEISGALATAATSPADTFATNLYHIQSYANTNVYTTVLCEVGHSASSVRRVVGLWRNNNAITAITLTPFNGSNWKAGSTFSLYGIKAA